VLRMKKTEVVAAIVAKTGLSKKDAEMSLQAILDTVTESLQKEEAVVFTGFGTFSVSHRKARQGVNPATGEKLQIPAMVVPKFKAGKGLKDAVKK